MILTKFNDFQKMMENRYNIINLKQFFPPFLTNRLGFTYFTGEDLDGKKIFVKMANGETTEREAQILQWIHAKTNSNHFPALIAHESQGPHSFVALEFIEGKSLKQCMLNGEINDFSKKEQVLKQMADILMILHKVKIIHRDVRPDNLMVCRNGSSLRLVLIDFAFSIGFMPNDHPELFILKRGLRELGGRYKYDSLKWDDAYSFSLIAKEIDPGCEKHFPEYWNKIHSSIGKLVYFDKDYDKSICRMTSRLTIAPEIKMDLPNFW
jgi:serine/threonine protein kinase